MNFDVFNKVYGENLSAEEVIANIEALEDEEVIKLATHEFIIFVLDGKENFDIEMLEDFIASYMDIEEARRFCKDMVSGRL